MFVLLSATSEKSMTTTCSKHKRDVTNPSLNIVLALAVFYVLLCSSHKCVANTCVDDEYTLDKDSNRCYTIIEADRMNYNDAEHHCKNIKGGHLPVVETEEDLQFFKDLPKVGSADPHTGYWLWASRFDHDKKFRWFDHDKKFRWNEQNSKLSDWSLVNTSNFINGRPFDALNPDAETHSRILFLKNRADEMLHPNIQNRYLDVKPELENYVICQKDHELTVIDGDWSDWLPWSSCSVTCNSGSKQRTRTCTDPSPTHGGKLCNGFDSQTESCVADPCQIDAQWSLWSEWNFDPTSCGVARGQRSRDCNNPEPNFGGEDCKGHSQQVTSIALVQCSVEGEWNSWEAWSSEPGGGSETASSSRNCSFPKPQFEGKPSGKNKGKETKNVSAITGVWSHWATWSNCSGKCGNETWVRRRSCTNSTTGLIPVCSLDDMNNVEEEACTSDECKVIVLPWYYWLAFSLVSLLVILLMLLYICCFVLQAVAAEKIKDSNDGERKASPSVDRQTERTSITSATSGASEMKSPASSKTADEEALEAFSKSVTRKFYKTNDNKETAVDKDKVVDRTQANASESSEAEPIFYIG